MTKDLREERIGQEKCNKSGRLMKVVEYNKYDDIIIEFQEDGIRKRTSWKDFSKGEVKHPDDKRYNAKAENKVGMKNTNTQGCLMKIVQYNTYSNIIVEFQDEYKYQKRTCFKSFLKGCVFNPYAPKAQDPKLKKDRVGSVGINKQGSKMKVILYNNKSDVTVEFQDEYKTKVHTEWKHFASGETKNPYAPSVLEVGIVGNKYPVTLNGKRTKEYSTWYSIILRTHGTDFQERCHTYKDITVCNEWLLYENFYEWLHSQENFEKWYNGKGWEVDKDILVKGNKIYSPETCCLVPHNVNTAFVKSEKTRGDLPIGVHHRDKDGFTASCKDSISLKSIFLGVFTNATDAFYAYKNFKEKTIKELAKQEYSEGNIIKRCYDAMMSYQVEITD